MSEVLFEEEQIFAKSAKLIKKSIDELLFKKNFVVLGLCGGRSITSILNELIKEDILWEKIHVFLVDERLVPIDDEESNFRLINESLSEVVPEENFHPFIFDKNNSLESYMTEIKKFGGSYDIVVLSAGEDGHIAALYPNHSSIFDESDFLILIDDSPKPPKDRMSISKKFLLKSKIGFLYLIGNSKRESLSNFSNEKIDYSKCPAKLVSELSKSYIFTDIKK
jgi:6-phosphogluconolactonase